MKKRWALSLPLEDWTLAEMAQLGREVEAMGYSDGWSGEVDGIDIFSSLAPLATGTTMRVGSAIANIYTRTPAVLAASAAGMSELSEGRFVLGLGAGSANIIERWNGIPFKKPVTRMREMAQVLRSALAGERVVFDGETIKVNGYRLARPPRFPVPIHIAALRGEMLKVAGAYGDGVILNWLGAEDVKKSVATARAAAEAAGKDPGALEFSARLFVSLDPPDTFETNQVLRRWVTTYLNVPTYRAFMAWLGHDGMLRDMWEAWDSGDRKAAVAHVPEKALTDFFITGTPEERRAHLQRYFDAGVDTAFLHFFSHEGDPAKHRALTYQGIKDMAPNA